MKILVTDSLAPQGLEVFQRAPGFEVDIRIGLKAGELKKIVADYDGWVIRSGTKITAELIEAAISTCRKPTPTNTSTPPAKKGSW